MALNEELAARQAMFIVVIVLVPLSIMASLNARRMLVGVHKKISDRIIISQLIFFAAMILYFFREYLGENPSNLIVEHLLILTSFAYAAYNLIVTKRKSEDWGILDA